MTTPETRYARSESVHIAYQAVGQGPPDLVFVPGFVSHVELGWEEQYLARFLRRLSSFARLIVFDKRGTGLSDPVPVAELPTLEQRMDDVRAVMDAAGAPRAHLLGISEGGPMNALFAATYPERTQSVTFVSSFARLLRAPDHPFGTPREVLEAWLERLEGRWGTGAILGLLTPDHTNDEQLRREWARYQRLSASPGAAVALLRMAMEIDVRGVLPAVRQPTLVLHRADDQFMPVEHGRHLARHIPGARYVELPGNDHLPWMGDADAVLGEIQEFTTGIREATEPDRILATLLFTDIVGSTALAAGVGDRAWADILARYQALVRHELVRFRGRELDTAGDGFLAAFDGPARAMRCAGAVVTAARGIGLEIRAGLHTGECELIGDKMLGIAVHIGARVAAVAAPGEVLVSSTVRDLVAGSGLRFAERGVHTLKGVPGDWALFAVEAAS